jgi:hypothetical protein
MPQAIGKQSLTYLCEPPILGEIEMPANDFAIGGIAPDLECDDAKH